MKTVIGIALVVLLFGYLCGGIETLVFAAASGVGLIGLMGCEMAEINRKLDRLLAQNPPNGGRETGANDLT